MNKILRRPYYRPLKTVDSHSSVSWVDEQEEEMFGPPAFEEHRAYFKWRLFKRKFVWGKSTQNEWL